MPRSLAAAAGLSLCAFAAQAAAPPVSILPRLPSADEATRASAGGQAELMAIRINDVEQPDAVLVVRLPGHAIALPAAALAAWRVRRPTAPLLRFEGSDYVLLGAIAGAQWQEDGATQTLAVKLPPAAFQRSEFEVVSQAAPTQSVAPLGGFVNYDLQWQRSGSSGAGLSTPQASTAANGLIEAGVFNARGNGFASGVWRSFGGNASFTRLDTTWNIDRPSALSSVRVGDSISVPGAWGRAVRFGGVQWATNFAVQPGLVSFPMPSIRGEATVPSIVDLYINNTHQLQGRVPAGAFDLPDVPVITGQGQIKMVVRDVLGREQVVVQPYYVSPALLRPGLHDFALEAGSVREDYGLESLRYGRSFVAATDRVGVTSQFTRELHVEALRDQQTAGVTGVWQWMQRATAHASAAASTGSQGGGWLAAAGVDHQDVRWSGNLQMRMSSRDFTSLGDTTATGVTQRSTLTAGLATSLGAGSLGVNVLQQSTWQDDRYRTVTLNGGRSLGFLGYISAFISRSFGTAAGTTVGINLIALLDGNTSASVGSYRSRDRGTPSDAAAAALTNRTDSAQTVVQLQGSAPAGPGFGYQVLAERGGFDRYSAEGTLQGERAAFIAGVARANGADAYRVGLKGAVAVMPEGIFLSRRIDGSFAVVQVGDYPGVGVHRDNQLVARTDASGRAFVAGLRGYESNQISVEGGDLPLDAQVDQLRIAVAPGMRSGVSVLFPVRRTRAASLRLVTADGEPVPAGVAVRIEGDAHEFPVGLDGKLFLAGLANDNRISAAWGARQCTAQIALAPAPDDVPELGTKVCR